MDQTIVALRSKIASIRDELTKQAFLPMPGDMPQQMQPGQGDPAQMQQGAPQGAPPPQGGQPPMDPAMMQQQGGQPPMDPAQMQQGAPPPAPSPGGSPDMAQVIDQLVQGLEEIFGIVQELGQALQQQQAETTQVKQQIDIIVKALDQPAPAPAGMAGPQPGAPMDPMMDPMAQQQGGPPPGAEMMAQGMQPGMPPMQ